MTPQPWTVEAASSIQHAARLMRTWGVREVLVTDQGRLCGLLTDADIIVLAIASGRHPSTLTAGEACTPVEHRLSAGQSITAALDYMRSHDVTRAPVVHHTHLVGTATTADLALAASHDPQLRQPA